MVKVTKDITITLSEAHDIRNLSRICEMARVYISQGAGVRWTEADIMGVRGLLDDLFDAIS